MQGAWGCPAKAAVAARLRWEGTACRGEKGRPSRGVGVQRGRQACGLGGGAAAGGGGRGGGGCASHLCTSDRGNHKQRQGHDRNQTQQRQDRITRAEPACQLGPRMLASCLVGLLVCVPVDLPTCLPSCSLLCTTHCQQPTASYLLTCSSVLSIADSAQHRTGSCHQELACEIIAVGFWATCSCARTSSVNRWHNSQN